MRQPLCASADGRAGGGHRRILEKTRRPGLARDRLSGGRRRQWARARRSRRVDGGNGAADHARPVLVDGFARRCGDRRGRRLGAAPGMAAADRRRRRQGSARLDRACAALGRCRRHPAGARDGWRLHPLRHQALRRGRASRRYSRRRRAHPRRQHDGGRRQPVPGAAGHARPDRRLDADDRRDPKVVRGPARQRRAAGFGAARRETRGLGAAVAGRRRGRPWRSAPRCAAARSRCST